MPSEFAPFSERELDIMAEIDPRPEPAPAELDACTYCGAHVETLVTVNDADMGPASACVECMALLETEAAQCA